MCTIVLVEITSFISTTDKFFFVFTFLHTTHTYGLFGYALFTLLFHFFVRAVMKEQDAKHENSPHHAECTGVIRIGTDDKPFVLRVLQWSDRYL